MSLENTLKENYCDGDLENTTLDIIKDEYINEGYSDVKVEEHSIDEEVLNLKNDTDSCHISDGDNNVKDEEMSKSKTHTNTHIREAYILVIRIVRILTKIVN